MNQKPDHVIVSEVLALLFTKHIDVPTVISIHPSVIEGVVDVLKEVATSDDEPQEARTFAAMAVCRIMSNIPFQPVETREVTPEQLAEALAAIPTS